MAYSTYLKYIFNVKIQHFVAAKPDPDPHPDLNGAALV
jgi:hypothetical protein